MKLTIVIPCRNEVEYIQECIDAIYVCELPQECSLQVFIVDGMSNDGTRALITSMIPNYNGLAIVDNKQQLTPFAFNLGIKAGGVVDYVQIVGARQILSPRYLLQAIRKFEENKEIGCVGGSVENVFLNSTGKIIAQAMSTSFGMGLGNFRTQNTSGFVDTVGTPMYPYDVFKHIGFFDENLIRNQDDDFNYRVIKSGKKILFNHEISLKYYVRGNFKGLWRQFFQYGYWKVYVNKKHKSVTTIRQLAPPLFVLYLMLLPIALLFGTFIAILGLIPLVLYESLVVLFSLKGKKDIQTFFGLVSSYHILHISYGLGYLKGIVAFLLFRRKPSDKQKRLSR